jgi:hypothetical protein
MKDNLLETLVSAVQWIEWEAQPEKITGNVRKENHNDYF